MYLIPDYFLKNIWTILSKICDENAENKTFWVSFLFKTKPHYSQVKTFAGWNTETHIIWSFMIIFSKSENTQTRLPSRPVKMVSQCFL